MTTPPLSFELGEAALATLLNETACTNHPGDTCPWGPGELLSAVSSVASRFAIKFGGSAGGRHILPWA